MAELSLARRTRRRHRHHRTQPAAPVHVQKLDKQGRAYATGKRKNAIARVWVKPGTGKIIVNGKEFATYFARPVLQMILQPADRRRQPRRPVRHHRHRRRRRPLRPGRRGASRHLQGADLLRAGAARRAQEGRLPDPRQPRRRAQEVRQGQGPPLASSSRSAKLPNVQTRKRPLSSGLFHVPEASQSRRQSFFVQIDAVRSRDS